MAPLKPFNPYNPLSPPATPNYFYTPTFWSGFFFAFKPIFLHFVPMAHAVDHSEILSDDLENKRFPDNLPKSWHRELSAEAKKDYFLELASFLKSELTSGQIVFPPRELMLSALQRTDYHQVRVCLLGQDPYHGDHQAMGLSFAVPNELRVKPPSLTNIFKELQSDLNLDWDRTSSDLTGWADQGVLLLNTVLSVRRGQAFSHRDKGWEQFTDTIIQKLNERDEPLVFILWGAAAQKKKALIDLSKHKIVSSPHPSPLSAHRGFFGSRPFSKTNAHLKAMGFAPIDWSKISTTDQ